MGPPEPQRIHRRWRRRALAWGVLLCLLGAASGPTGAQDRGRNGERRDPLDPTVELDEASGEGSSDSSPPPETQAPHREAQDPSGTLRLDARTAEEIAVANDPQLKIIRYEQTVRELTVDESWREYFPTASVSWNRTTSITENEDDARSQSLRLNVDQVVYDGGRRDLSLQAAKEELSLSSYEYELAVNNLRLEVRTTFYEILSSKARIDVLQRSRARQEEQLRFARAELELGETTRVEVLEIENRLNEIILQQKSAQIEYRQALDQFKILLRLDSAARIALAGDLLNNVNLGHRDLNDDAIIARAFRERVEFPRARSQAAQSLARYEIAKSYYVPQISVGGYYGYTGDRYPPREREWGFNFRITMLLGPNTFSDSANVGVRREGVDRSINSDTTLNILDRMDYKREIVQTGIAAVRARLDHEQLPEIIRIEVKQSLDNYRESWDALKLADQNIEIFEKRLEINELQTSLGDLRRVDLAETEIRYLEARNAQIAARLRYLSSVAQLELAAGMRLDELRLIQFQNESP